MKSFLPCGCALSWLLVITAGAHAQQAAQPVRFMLHGNMSHELPTEDYLQFVEQARPDILIMGVFDQRLYALAAPPKKSTRKVQDPGELLAGWKAVADRLHRKGIRLIGQMELFVVSDQPKERDEGAGWFGFYDKHWNEKLLGKRPTKTAQDLLAHTHAGAHGQDDKTALCGCRINTKAVLGCVNNPSWQEVQKRMVQAAVATGVDGFMTNRNFFEHCDCSYCQEHFRRWLGERYTAAELQNRFGITNLATRSFCVAGTYRVLEETPDALHLEKLRFVKARVREFFEEVYIRHGRSLKKDLFAAQWNHLAYFDELHLDRGHLPISTRTTLAHALADERWGLPASLWGRGESLLWYCNWGTTQNTILAKEYAGDTVLYGLYVRALFARGTPYVINKYDFYRPRVMMAEAAALGYATNAIATPWQHEEDRDVVLRYFRFLRKHDDLYQSATRQAEVGLVFPRRAIHAGDASSLEYVEACGRTLIREHLLFDMIPDDLLAQTPLDSLRTLVVAAPEYLTTDEIGVLRAFTERGGKLLWTPVNSADRDRPGVRSAGVKPAAELPKDALRVENVRTERGQFSQSLWQAAGARETWSQVAAPWTVELHAYRQEARKRWIVHLVNYNHKENAPGKSVAAREAPIAAEPVAVQFKLPASRQIRQVRFLSPDAEGDKQIPFRQEAGFVRFTAPSFLVYGVCVLEE